MSELLPRGEASFTVPLAKIIIDFESLHELNREVADYFDVPFFPFTGGLGININAINTSVTGAVEEAKQARKSQEIAVREAGYTDDEWLSNWRPTMFRYNFARTLPEGVRSTIFEGIIHFAVPEVVEQRVDRLRKSDRIRTSLLGAIAATGVLSLANGVDSPLDVALPIFNTWAVYTLLQPNVGNKRRTKSVLESLSTTIQEDRPRVRRLLEDTVRAFPRLNDT